MSKVEVRLNTGEVRKLLKSQEIKGMLQELSSGIASRCGDGYKSDVKDMGTRSIASAYTDTPEAMRDNLKNNTLLKGLK